MMPAGFRFPVPSPVKHFLLKMVLGEWRGTAVSLPGHLLWALALNEGDALLTEQETPEIWRFRPRGEGGGVLGPEGALDLAGRFEPGEPLLLRAEGFRSESWFTLRRAGELRPSSELSAVALYRLRVEPGYRVVLPPDALWALALAGGGTVACRTVMWTLEGGDPPEVAGQPAKVVIETGGALRLPERLHQYAALQPGSDVRFEVSLSGPKSSFRLEPDLSLP